ncbi:MAG: hypothetical protein MUP15_03470 [Dehalococcoidia bacterium]|nr:hypothetical protein [Dehalococcoidia bacterium]
MILCARQSIPLVRPTLAALDAGAFVGLSQIRLDLSQIQNRTRKNVEFKYSIKAMVLPVESALDASDPL